MLIMVSGSVVVTMTIPLTFARPGSGTIQDMIKSVNLQVKVKFVERFKFCWLQVTMNKCFHKVSVIFQFETKLIVCREKADVVFIRKFSQCFIP